MNRFSFASAGIRASVRLLAGLAGMLLAGAGAVGQSVVVDDSDGAPTYTETGEWSTTSNTGAGYNGGLYRFSSTNRPPSTATWTPALPSEGAYEVFAIFRRSADRTSRAPYSIVHADGTTVRELDQTGSFSGDLAMESLGAYRFLAGTSGSVSLSNSGGTGSYIADAMLFQPDSAPTISNVRRSPLYPTAAASVQVTARVVDNGTVASVRVQWSVPAASLSGEVGALDDGTAGDAVAGDAVYTATLPAQADGSAVFFTVVATDGLGSESTSGPHEYVVGATGTWQLVINEVMASNSATASDPDFGESGDWMEILNLGPDTADLTGLALSDSATNRTKWLFPAGVTLDAGAYLMVWCDDYNMAGAALHTNFKLSASGEAASLYNTATQQVIDETSWTAMATDESLARFPNATGDFVLTIVPTPGSENLFGERGDAPVLSEASGFKAAPISVTITAPDATAIRYTLDGSIPDTTSTVYANPIPVSTTKGLRARAWYTGKDPSLITSASYFFQNEADRTIPVMNLVVDPDDLFDSATGIYTNFNERGDAWERPAHVLLFSPDGSVQQSFDAGLRMHGGFSRGAAKKSFRLYLSNVYGTPEVSLPWMERTTADAINQIVLRAGGNDGFLVTSTTQLQQVNFIRDQIMRDWYDDQGQYAADGFFFALYLNGQYWGLYNATERITDDQMGTIFGGGSDYDIAKGTWTYATKFYTEAVDGDLNAWNDLLAWHATSNIATAQGLEDLKQRIDYRNFLDFFALNIFCQNEDWPHNNWIASRHRTQPDARWVFHEWDTEWGLGLRPNSWNSDTQVWAEGSNFHLSTSHNGFIAPLSSLFNGNNLDTNRPADINGILDNPEGVRDYLAAMDDLLNFVVRADKAIGEFNHYATLIQTEVPREATRWASSTSQSAATLQGYWNNSVVNTRNFIQNRPAVIRGLLVTRFSLAGTRTITFQSAGAGSGRLSVRGHVVDLPWTGTFFDGASLDLSGIADADSEFASWSGLVTGSTADLTTTVAAGANATVTLTFDLADTTPQPNAAIFNEYWVNDNATFYPSIGAPIDRDWFELLVVEDGLDMRGWRITGNPAIDTIGALDSGSIILPSLPVLASVPKGTILLIVSSINDVNTASFPADDLDAADGRLVFYAGNGNLDVTTDPNFGIGTSDDALVLLAPGGSSAFADDIGIDFIAEGTRITPASFFGTPAPVTFAPPFAGIGSDDGAVFTNDATGGFNNDDGTDNDRTDFVPGPGGWIVDPPSAFTGDAVPVQENRLTPGARNWGQDLGPLRGSAREAWVIR